MLKYPDINIKSTDDNGQTVVVDDRLNARLRLGEQLAFPDWYGSNFDALYDCLTDPEILPAGGQLILLRGLAPLQQLAPDACATLIDVMSDACGERRASGLPLWLLIDQPLAGVPPLA